MVGKTILISFGYSNSKFIYHTLSRKKKIKQKIVSTNAVSQHSNEWTNKKFSRKKYEIASKGK